jgi:uncharacterized protein YgbK (DUF1537 family)
MTEQPLETGSGIAVLADDLSGAAEVAGVFLGRDVPLFLQLNDFQPSPGVTVIDLNTRAMAPQKAAQTIRAALADIPADIHVVKKIDSLLRGHIGTEVAVLAERGLVIMTAALPGLGRTPSVHDVAQLFADRPLAAGRLEIHDAATDADLDEIVRVAPPGAQLVGTSALAAAVARTLPLAHQKIDVRPPAKAVLTVVGTAAPVAPGQVDALIVDGAHAVTVDARALLHDKADPEPVQRALDHGSAVVTIGGIVEPAETQAVSIALGEFIAAAERQHRPDLVVTGGETARAVVDAIAINTLQPVHEIHHGAVVSVASDGRRVVTRPGSFGAINSLVNIVRYLTQRSEDNS